MEDAPKDKKIFFQTANYIVFLLLIAFLYFVSQHNFLLFHAVAEIFSIAVSCAVFMIAWNARKIIGNNYLLLVGISLLFVGVIDTIHMLAYKGMGVFPGQDANRATQLWIAARFLQAFSFLAAPFLFDRKMRFEWIVAVYAAATALLMASIFIWKNFPECFVEGVGLTGFKKASEYVISGIFLASGGVLLAKRDKFDRDVLELLALSIVLMIAAELAFTLYVSVYGLSNLVGHFFKILAFMLVYRAVVETGFSKPYGLIFREMKKNEEALLRSKEELEEGVRNRTTDLDKANRMLREEAFERDRAFDALRENEEKFHLLFTRMVSGFALHEIICDAGGKPCDYRFLDINPAFEKITGLRREEVIGKTVLEVLPGTEDHWIRTYGEVALSGKPAHFEEHSAALDKHFEVMSYSPKQGQFAVTFTDITGRKKAEEQIGKRLRIESALRKIDEKILSGANHLDALEIACDAVVELGYRMCWIGMAKPDGTILPISYRGFEEGYLEKIKVRWDDSPEGRGPTGTSIRTGQPYVTHSIRNNYLYAPWRDEALKRGYLSSAAFPLKTGVGETIGTFHVYSAEEGKFDQDEIRTLETFAQQCAIAVVNAWRLEKLRDAHQRLSFHVNRMPLAYIAWDREFRVTEWNPAAERIFGWKPEEMMGKHPYGYIVPRGAQSHVDLVWSKLMGGEESSYSLNANLRKDGNTITCEWFNTPLRDSSGQVAGVLSMVHDVTEKTQLERQLQTAQKMEAVGTLAGGIAHDFNNALTGIFGFSEMLRLKMSGNEHALSDVSEILRCAERASTLTRQLLTYARRQVIEPVNLSLNKVIADLLKLVSKVVGEHIEIRTYLAKDLPTVRADIGQIEQVVMNLVLNARDAMPGGGHLLIETEVANLDAEYVRYHPYMRAGSYVVLTVSDTGIGMDQKTQERVFEPFFTTKTHDKGTGLGLAMVYGIVKQHEGFIHLYSEPGKGTTFKIYLPPVEAPPDEIKSSPIQAARGGTETVLLAEDDESVRMLVERTLVDLGYTVLAARNGADAVELFRRNMESVSLAVLDVVMPVKGGKEAYEEMHKSKPDLKVIFISGYTANVVHESFVLLAGVPFLAKPFGPDALARKVREVLDR